MAISWLMTLCLFSLEDGAMTWPEGATPVATTFKWDSVADAGAPGSGDCGKGGTTTADPAALALQFPYPVRGAGESLAPRNYLRAAQMWGHQPWRLAPWPTPESVNQQLALESPHQPPRSRLSHSSHLNPQRYEKALGPTGPALKGP